MLVIAKFAPSESNAFYRECRGKDIKNFEAQNISNFPLANARHTHGQRKNLSFS